MTTSHFEGGTPRESCGEEIKNRATPIGGGGGVADSASCCWWCC